MKNGKQYANVARANLGLDGAIAHTIEFLANPPLDLTPDQQEKFLDIARRGLKRLLRSKREMQNYGFSQGRAQ